MNHTDEGNALRKSGSAGQAAAELALLLPVLLLITLGCLDLGRAFSTWVTLSNAAREGARYGCLYPWDGGGIAARVQDEALAGGLPADHLHVAVAPGTAGGPPTAVTATFDLQMMTAYLFGAGPLPVRARAQMAILPGGS